MDTGTAHLIAGLMIMAIGVAALVVPIYKAFKSPEPTNYSFKNVIVGVVTVVLGGLVAANKTEQILDYARRFGAMIATLGAG